ncbi:MAG: hypothetical protein M9934_13960 [Thermomicrobiales bacterium]|nr:hypothetical protein [Thermomicrobiales bacterium]
MTVKLPQSDEAITNATGKGWDAWKAILDEWNAPAKSHTEIARYLSDEHGVPDWWAQGVTVGYERMIGRREAGQRNDGSYSASTSKTIAAPMSAVHAALVDDAQRDQWLPTGSLSLRTQQVKSARFDEAETGLIVAFFLTAKVEKTAVQVQVDGLASADDADAWKAVWKTRLSDLATHLDNMS